MLVLAKARDLLLPQLMNGDVIIMINKVSSNSKMLVYSDMVAQMGRWSFDQTTAIYADNARGEIHICQPF